MLDIVTVNQSSTCISIQSTQKDILGPPHALPIVVYKKSLTTMSDYGDDSDYEVDWMWIEEEYSIADDLAEHAVHSPPPTLCIDDELTEWDRYDYFNDLEYDSDGYDEATFVPHNSKDAKVTQRTGHKRKRNGTSQRERKRPKVMDDLTQPLPSSVLSPVTWRSRGTPAVPIIKGESLKTYGFLKDWKRTMPKTPTWATASASKSGPSRQATKGTSLGKVVDMMEGENDEEREDDAGEVDTVDPAALMAALQKNLAAAGGPLAGMDPQQLLQFAMRMMNDQDAGDDIAGELADDMLQGDGEEGEDGEDDGELMSWLARHRNSTQTDPVQADEDGANSSTHKRINHRPPKQSSLKTVQNALDTEDVEAVQQFTPVIPDYPAIHKNPSQAVPSRKRKADEDIQDDGSSMTAPKKQATRSNEASTRATQAKAEMRPRTTRGGRTKRT